MYTSAECRAIAEQKLAQAKLGEGNRKRLVTAAEAWFFLANRLNAAPTKRRTTMPPRSVENDP
jgi:hypothetical protein